VAAATNLSESTSAAPLAAKIAQTPPTKNRDENNTDYVDLTKDTPEKPPEVPTAASTSGATPIASASASATFVSPASGVPSTVKKQPPARTVTLEDSRDSHGAKRPPVQANRFSSSSEAPFLSHQGSHGSAKAAATEKSKVRGNHATDLVVIADSSDEEEEDPLLQAALAASVKDF
jgi:hypothetical protein